MLDKDEGIVAEHSADVNATSVSSAAQIASGGSGGGEAQGRKQKLVLDVEDGGGDDEGHVTM